MIRMASPLCPAVRDFSEFPFDLRLQQLQSVFLTGSNRGERTDAHRRTGFGCSRCGKTKRPHGFKRDVKPNALVHPLHGGHYSKSGLNETNDSP